jgi:hypothetical protein
MKKLYRVKDNPYVTRSTDRDYSHAVIVNRKENGTPCTWSFCRTEGLAQKKYRELYKYYGDKQLYTITINETILIK